MWMLALALIPLCACQTLRHGTFSSIQRFRYGNGTVKVIVAPGAAIDAHCRKRGVANDDKGIKIGQARRIRACTDVVRSTIWISDDSTDLIYHELCHLSGKTPEECSKVRLEPE